MKQVLILFLIVFQLQVFSQETCNIAGHFPDFSNSKYVLKGYKGLLQITVIIHDKLVGVYHDLSLVNNTFTKLKNILNEIFEIVYNNGVLSNDNFEQDLVDLLLNHKQLSIQVATNSITAKVFDSKIYQTKTCSTSFLNPQAVIYSKSGS